LIRIAESAAQLGAGIRALRKERKWKQSVLAEAAGLSVPTISLIETSKTNPSHYDLERIAQALETTIPGLMSAGSNPLYKSDINMKKIVGERVRLRREFLGLSRLEVGSKVGLLEQYLSTTENGKRLPRVETILKLSIALEVKPSWILGEGKSDPHIGEGEGVNTATLVERMRALRDNRGLSRDRIGRQTGLSAAHIYQLESGRQKPTVATLTAFCTGTNIPLSALLDA
jgi:transcriptional regulator with XRE-family HTH domain